jgi:hypothetical protein
MTSSLSVVPFGPAPIGALSTVASAKFTVPKSASGSTVASLGASAMTSAEPSCAPAAVCCVVCVQSCVASLKVSVKTSLPSEVTEADMASPGCTGLA